MIWQMTEVRGQIIEEGGRLGRWEGGNIRFWIADFRFGIVEWINKGQRAKSRAQSDQRIMG